MKKKLYLGDGLYGEYDGYQITLKANSETAPSDIVYLDPRVWATLQEFIERCNKEFDEEVEAPEKEE